MQRVTAVRMKRAIPLAVLTPPAAPDTTPRTFAVYGRIPAAQDKPLGSYSDTVIATVNF